MIKVKSHYAWLILLGVILIRGFAGGGINMTSGLFLSPVSQDIGVGIGSLSIYFSISSIVLVLWLPIAGKLINKYDIRLIAIVGAFLQALSFVAFGSMNNVYAWYLLAIPHAMGAALIVNLLGPIMINRWFAKNEGLMLGIQMTFVGISGAILQPITSTIIQRHGWRNAYYFIGWITFVVVIFSALTLLKNKPSDLDILPYGKDDNTEKLTKNHSKEYSEVSESAAIHSASFYLLIIFMISITGVGVFTQHIAPYGTMLGYSTQSTGSALAFASIGNAIGSIAIGIISDRLGSLKTCYCIIAFGFLAIMGFSLSSLSFTIFSIATFLHGLATSGIMVLAPILTIKFFGQKDYEKIYAKISMGAPLASIILIPTYGYIYDIMKNYFFVLITMTVLLIVATFCIGIGWKKRAKINLY